MCNFETYAFRLPPLNNFVERYYALAKRVYDNPVGDLVWSFVAGNFQAAKTNQTRWCFAILFETFEQLSDLHEATVSRHFWR